MIGKKPPPAPGTVDQQLTSVSLLPTVGLSELHNELDIPSAPDTPYALQLMLDLMRAQYLQMVDTMKDPKYRDKLIKDIELEKVSSQSRTLDVVHLLINACYNFCKKKLACAYLFFFSVICFGAKLS